MIDLLLGRLHSAKSVAMGEVAGVRMVSRKDLHGDEVNADHQDKPPVPSSPSRG